MASNPLIARLAESAGITESQYYTTIMKTVMPSGVTNEQVLAFLHVAGRYNLDPFTKEIYAFPAKGGIQPVVSIDGWMKLANSHTQFDGLEHEDVADANGELVAVICKVYRKDRAHPVTATEYLAECKRNTEPWKQWPRRMLRHKATIQAIRYAFGFAGIIDPDEADRYHEAEVEDVTEAKNATVDRAGEIRKKITAASSRGAPQAGADPNLAAAPSPQPSDNEPDEHGELFSGSSLGTDDVNYGEVQS